MSKITDPIADYLTRVRNAIKAGHRTVDVPASNLKREITRVLHESGYILQYKFEETENKQGKIRIALKYDRETRQPAILHMEKISKPGLRMYSNADELPRVLNGLGIAIMSTNKGVMTDKQARREHVGGEVLCYIY